MKLILNAKVKERLQGYYPNDKFSLCSINRVNTKPNSTVHRIRIFDKSKGYQDLYAKECQTEVAPNIHEMISLKDSHERLLIPRIMDYYEEENIVLSEGVKGETLSKSLLKHSLSLGFALNTETLLMSSRKIGHAIGVLQNLTNRGTERLGDLDIYLIKEIENEEYFKTILKKDLLKDIKAQTENLKGLKTNISQYHGDPSPHNIFMKDDQVHLIDYSFHVNATFLDPALYLVSLELARSRLFHSIDDTVLKMENVFLYTYAETIKHDDWIYEWPLIKTLTYLHFLLMYAKRKKTIKNSLVASIDRRYLIKKIIEHGKRQHPIPTLQPFSPPSMRDAEICEQSDIPSNNGKEVSDD